MESVRKFLDLKINRLTLKCVYINLNVPDLSGHFEFKEENMYFIED